MHDRDPQSGVPKRLREMKYQVLRARREKRLLSLLIVIMILQISVLCLLIFA